MTPNIAEIEINLNGVHMWLGRLPITITGCTHIPDKNSPVIIYQEAMIRHYGQMTTCKTFLLTIMSIMVNNVIGVVDGIIYQLFADRGYLGRIETPDPNQLHQETNHMALTRK